MEWLAPVIVLCIVGGLIVAMALCAIEFDGDPVPFGWVAGFLLFVSFLVYCGMSESRAYDDWHAKNRPYWQDQD